MTVSQFDMPWLHSWKDSEDCYHSVFGLCLESCTILRGDSGSDTERMIWRSHEDFLRTFEGFSVNRSIALRYHWLPSIDDTQLGTLKLSIFGKISSDTKANAQAQALVFYKELNDLIAGSFVGLDWEGMTNKEQFNLYWNAMDWGQADVAEISRREKIGALGGGLKRPVLGNRGVDQFQEGSEPQFFHHVYPFSARTRPLSRLLRVISLSRHDFVWQVNLRPTRPDQQIQIQLHNMVEECEKALYALHQGKELEEGLTVELLEVVIKKAKRQLVNFKDGCLKMSVLMASHGSLPQSIVNSVGVEISGPVCTDEDYEGGFTVIKPDSKDHIGLIRRNISDVLFNTATSDEQYQKKPPVDEVYYQLIDASEVIGAFRLPYTFDGDLAGIKVVTSRTRPFLEPACHDSCQDQVLLGVNKYFGKEKQVFVPLKDRLQHTYVMGQTGTGKTTFLKNMIMHDMQEGHGVAVVDPHGDLFDELLSSIPLHRRKDVIVFDPADIEFPIGLNLLACKDPQQKYFVVREMKAIMARLLSDQYGGASKDFAGPVFYQHMQMNLLLAMSDSEPPGTLLDFYKIFQSKDYWERWQDLEFDDPQLKRWVTDTLPNMNYTSRTSDHQSYGEYLSSKFDDFVFDPVLRRIFGQASSLDFRDIMDQKKILLINLSKGALTETNANFLGMIVMSKFQVAAMSRVKQPREQRTPFFLYVDEFQNFATENFSLMLSEARKFGLGLVLANQFLSQIEDKKIQQAVFGNVGTTIAFRTGMKDAEMLENIFQPAFDSRDIVNLSNWTACVKTTLQGHSIHPFTLQTLPDVTKGSQKIRSQVVSHSREKYARYYRDVDKLIELV